MMKVGIVGWRGMVGSVLMERMRAEGDFDLIEPVFFSTSQAGERGPDVGKSVAPLRDAGNTDELARMEVIISCQGGDYTRTAHSALRKGGWSGYWIDAASALRMIDRGVAADRSGKFGDGSQRNAVERWSGLRFIRTEIPDTQRTRFR